MTAIFEPLKIFSHLGGAPRWIAGQLCERVPIGVVGIDHNHRIVGGTAAQRSSTGIEDAIVLTPEVRIPRLLCIIGVVPYEEIPPEGGILRSKGMKERNVIVIRQAGIGELQRVTAGFKEEGPAKIHWSTEKSFVASSGDLGVSIGMIRPNDPPKAGEPVGFPFFTVWKREGPDQPWRYIAE